jgi:uncharacterized protein YjbI with pentapeptide repeats
MATAQKNHIDILKLGVSEWNKWRVEQTNIAPDLKGADLRGAAIAGADLRAVNLKGADLREANLRGANLKAADLRGANLKGAILWSASLTGADLREADLTGADLRGVNFRAADLMNAILVGVSTNDYTDFRHATVTGIRLREGGEPVADDWETETLKISEIYTSKISVTIKFQQHLSASDLASLASMLDVVFLEYERMFISSQYTVVGDLLTDACLYRLEKEREQIFRCTRFETTGAGASGIEAVLFPLGFQILVRAVFRDMDDIWKRVTFNEIIKKALVNRANNAEQELQKLFRATITQWESLKHFDLNVKAQGELNKAPNLMIELVPGKNAEEPPPK